VTVGLSGGIDSVVLLDLLDRIAARRHFSLQALHVNHQLSPNARRWAEFCRALCKGRGIPLKVARVAVRRGNSLEAAARDARYAVFRRQRTDFIALAHNRDDQSETVLLQLLRGGGVKGLAAMPLVRDLAARPGTRAAAAFSIRGPRIFRPLLEASRGEIERYARRRKLAWVEDESNDNTYFPRNFLRHEVLPLIAQKFPAHDAVLARAAGHFAEAAQLLDELAASDGREWLKAGTLQVAGLRALSPPRAKNLLRYFLACCGAAIPGAERLEEALRQAMMAKNDAMVCIDLGDVELRRYAGALQVVSKAGDIDPEFSRTWRGERELGLPELNGILTMTRCRDAGISLARLASGPVTIRLRRGGERLQPDCARPRRSLKNLLQESGIPPWQRNRLPVIYCGHQPVWMPGIGIDCGFQAGAGEAGIEAEWRSGQVSDW
jgi:tRNA(Ile)-lysidine synthase